MTRRIWKVVGSGLLALAAGSMVSGADSAPQPGGVYAQLIGPILQARCTECHGEQKQRAKLALHTWEGLRRGSDAGPVVAAGKPKESSLLERLKLPLADEEHMPPSDQPQPAPEEIAFIEHWIAKGASPSLTVTQLELPPELAKAVEPLRQKLMALAQASPKAEPRWEFDPAAVEKRRGPLAARMSELQRRFPGALSYESRTSVDIVFTAAGLGREFGDAEFAALESLQDAIVTLDLSNTSVTDASAQRLAAFTRLRSLRAAATALGDETAKAVATLPALESLTLQETKLTGASVQALSRMKKLRVLRVGGTAAEQAARDANLPVALAESR